MSNLLSQACRQALPYRGTIHETQFGTNRHGMKHTLGTAAKACGKSKSSIYRAIKSGVISASRRDDGQYEIDPAELHRAFPAVSRNVPEGVPDDSVARERNGEKRERELLEREIARLEETVADLRRERDRLLKLVDEQAGTVRLLTHQTASGPRRRFNWPLAVALTLLFTLVAYVGSLLVLTPEPTKPVATPQKSPPRAPSEIWKPDSNGG